MIPDFDGGEDGEDDGGDDAARRKQEDFIDWGMAFGGEYEEAEFSYIMIATEIQREVQEVVSVSGSSFRNLLLEARGTSEAAVGLPGKVRGFMVISAIALVLEYRTEVIRAVAWVNNADGDEFELELVPGGKLVSPKRVDIFWKHGLIDDRVRGAMMEGIDNGISPLVRLSRGDIITSKPASLSKTASERLEDSYKTVKNRLPTKVKVAKVTRVDWSDHSVKWRCMDSYATGWCRMDGVVLANTTREEDPDDDDEGSRNLFAGKYG